MKAGLDPQYTYAILIGMTEFKGFAPMPPASRNVEQLATLLADQSILGLPQNNIKKIINVNSSDVKGRFSEHVSEAKDIQIKSLLIYYVGHGYLRTDRQYFLTATNSETDLINLDGSSAISYEGAIKKILKSANIPQIFVFVDACYSGTLAQNGEITLPEIDLLASYTLTSSAVGEESFFNPAHDYTYFTAELINLLQYGLPNGRENLTLADIYDTLKKNIRGKGLGMSPQQSTGKELEPHLYIFCKNKNFDPGKRKIQQIEAELAEIQQNIKNGKINFSASHLRTLKGNLEQGIISNLSANEHLLEQVDNLLTFCNWYHQYETTFINEIIENTIHSKLIPTQEKLDEINNKLLSSSQELLEAKEHLQTKNKQIIDLEEKLTSLVRSDPESAYYQKLDFLKLLAMLVLQEQKKYEMISDADVNKQLIIFNEHKTFRILVIGEDNVGKSTLLNALIGEEILPPSAVSCTSVPTTLKYCEVEQAVLYLRNKKNGKVEVPIEKLSDYILKNRYKNKNDIQENSITHAEVGKPSGFLKFNNLEITDTPGFNEDKTAEDIIANNLLNIDLIIFVMSALHFGPRSAEISIINRLRSSDYFDIFFVINHWDVPRKLGKDEIKFNALNVLPEFTDHKQNIFFVSAENALEEKNTNTLGKERDNGFKDFEDSLNRFLSTEIRSTKLRRNAREISKNINNLRFSTIPERIKLLETELNEKKIIDRLDSDYSKILGNHPELHQFQNLLNESKENLNEKIVDLKNFKSRLEQIEKYLEVLINSKPS